MAKGKIVQQLQLLRKKQIENNTNKKIKKIGEQLDCIKTINTNHNYKNEREPKA